MKVQVTNYTFDKTAKTVTFTDYTSIRLDSVLLITNVTDNVFIYNFADPTLGGTVATNVLTLTYNTATMDDTDSLQIFYDDGDVQPANAGLQTTLNSLTETLQELTARLEVLAGMANAGQPALRVIPIASVSTAVTGSVTATVASTVVSSMTNIGTVPATTVAWSQGNLLATQANINNATA
jgi:hypothetical protein